MLIIIIHIKYYCTVQAELGGQQRISAGQQ